MQTMPKCSGPTTWTRSEKRPCGFCTKPTLEVLLRRRRTEVVITAPFKRKGSNSFPSWSRMVGKPKIHFLQSEPTYHGKTGHKNRAVQSTIHDQRSTTNDAHPLPNRKSKQGLKVNTNPKKIKPEWLRQTA